MITRLVSGSVGLMQLVTGWPSCCKLVVTMVTLYLLYLQVGYMTGPSVALILMDTGRRALTPVVGNILPMRGTGSTETSTSFFQNE